MCVCVCDKIKDEDKVQLDDQEISRNERFPYFGSIIQKDEKIEKYVNHRIRAM